MSAIPRNHIFRKARRTDIPVLHDLISRSAHALASQDYSKAQIKAAIGTVWGVDEELISDQTYFVCEIDCGNIVACGGWSKRKKLFGASSGQASPLLDPKHCAARIRAFFVDPNYARLGIGREIIRLCEGEAKKLGFSRMELMATLPGARLYAACGYQGSEIVSVPCGNTAYAHDCIPMHKAL